MKACQIVIGIDVARFYPDRLFKHPASHVIVLFRDIDRSQIVQGRHKMRRTFQRPFIESLGGLDPTLFLKGKAPAV
jgi:hypothetical protein